jgi:hypothetical protein
MAVISETVRGGATRLTGALLAAVAASAAASSGLGADTLAGSNSLAVGREAAIALCTQALTLGPAVARQASKLPPPARMHAMTIGLPTVLRQFSIAWLSSSAEPELTEKNRKRMAAPKGRANAISKSLQNMHFLKSAICPDYEGDDIRVKQTRGGTCLLEKRPFAAATWPAATTS